METTERRIKLLKRLNKSQNTKVSDLADEFRVCNRTIRRDIQILKHFFPVYTKTEKYNGGVYVGTDLSFEGIHFPDEQKLVLEKLLMSKVQKGTCSFSSDEIEYLIHAVSEYTSSDKKIF